MVQSLQVPRNVYVLNITCYHMPKYFQVSEEKNPNKHILVLRWCKTPHIGFFPGESLLIGFFDF